MLMLVWGGPLCQLLAQVWIIGFYNSSFLRERISLGPILIGWWSDIII
jgi:hypothetical protein